MARRFTHRIASAAAVTIALALAACSEPAPPEETTSGQDDAPDEVRVLFASAVNNVPVMVAAEQGFWRDRGLDVTVQVLDSGSEIATALVTGAADLGAANAATAIPLSRAAGNDLVIVGPYHNNPLAIESTARVAIIGRADSGVREGDPQSLVGASIGVTSGSTTESFLSGYLADHGLSMADVEPVNLSVADMPTALSQGNVDVVVPWEPQVSEIIRTQGDDVTVVQRGGPYGRSVVGVAVTGEYLAANEDIVERYVLGAWEGDQFTRENPEEAAVIAQRYISGLNVEDAASGIAQMAGEFDPRISVCTETAVVEEQEVLIASGAMDLTEPMPYTDIVAVDFVQRLIDENPDLFSDLPPLPATAAECQ